MNAKSETFQVRIAAIAHEAPGINSYELWPVGESGLPSFTAGAHIDVHLLNGIVRSYSLVNAQAERHRYVIAVARDAASRGGSQFMHEGLRVGDELAVSAPRNNFPLAEDAPHSLFIAGGIGITPLWCMIQRLEALGKSWELHYCARTRDNAAFLGQLQGLRGGSGRALHLNFDREPGGRMLDMAAVAAAAPADAHLYCCGPASMLSAFEQATSARPPHRVHVEYFAPKEAPSAGGGFKVTLARSGRTIDVPPGKTILRALLDAGLDPPHACMEGVCGVCETAVLAGVPDHRDSVLSAEAKSSGGTMMICCSGCKGGSLVLDL